MAVHQVGRVVELDSTGLEFRICSSNILDAKIQQRLGGKREHWTVVLRAYLTNNFKSCDATDSDAHRRDE
jgi:hypothetical protein